MPRSPVHIFTVLHHVQCKALFAEACPNLAANQTIKRVDCKVISFQLDSENSALWVVETWGASCVSAEIRCERSTGSKNAVKLAFDWAAHTDFGVQLPFRRLKFCLTLYSWWKNIRKSTGKDSSWLGWDLLLSWFSFSCTAVQWQSSAHPPVL